MPITHRLSYIIQHGDESLPHGIMGLFITEAGNFDVHPRLIPAIRATPRHDWVNKKVYTVAHIRNRCGDGNDQKRGVVRTHLHHCAGTLPSVGFRSRGENVEAKPGASSGS